MIYFDFCIFCRPKSLNSLPMQTLIPSNSSLNSCFITLLLSWIFLCYSG